MSARMGSFTVYQLREIAFGLERNGQQFLWVVKTPLIQSGLEEKRVALGKNLEPDLEELLPEGFVERTEGRGMVVKAWALQTAVLEHEAMGRSVSHCGWNSMLEAVILVNSLPIESRIRPNMGARARRRGGWWWGRGRRIGPIWGGGRPEGYGFMSSTPFSTFTVGFRR